MPITGLGSMRTRKPEGSASLIFCGAWSSICGPGLIHAIPANRWPYCFRGFFVPNLVVTRLGVEPRTY